MIKKILLITLLILVIPTVLGIQANIHGIDNVNNFISKQNSEKLIAEIFIENIGSINPEQVRLEYTNDYKTFNTCTEDSPGIQKCVYEETPAIAGAYTIAYYDIADIRKPQPTPIFSEELIVRQDLYGPESVEFNLKPKITNQNNVEVEYIIKDYSDTIGDTRYCSGIKSVTLDVDNGDTRTEQGNGLCEQKGVLKYSFQTNQLHKKMNVCLSAQDKLNQVSVQWKKCEELIYDLESPSISDLTFKDVKGNVLTHVSNNNPFEADVFVKIVDADLNKNSVRADFSKLNPAENERVFDDEFPDNIFSWNVKITNPQNCEVLIKASDNLGNNAEEKLSCSFPLDNTRPEVLSLTGEKLNKDGETIIGGESVITAVFKDDDSGVSKAFLDASQLGMNSKVESENCENNACNFIVKPTNINEGTYTILVSSDTTDNVGNPISNSLPLSVIYDSSPPIITSVESFIVSGVEKKEVLVKGVTLKLVVKGNDLSNIEADFSSIGDGLNQGVCKQDTDGTLFCAVNGIVKNSGYYSFKIPITIYDDAGNKINHDFEGEVFELTGGQQTYWDFKTSCSPQKLDRQLTGVKHMKFFCHVHLTPANIAQKPEILKTKLDFSKDCVDKSGMISDVKINNANSRDPYLEITLDKISDPNTFDSACNLHVYTKLGNKIVDNAQVINVPFNIEFYNQPLGDIYKSYTDEVNRAVKKAENFGADYKLDKLSESMDFIEDVCNTKNVITDVMTTLYFLSNIVGGVEDYISWLPGAGQAAYTVRNSLCQTGESVKENYLGDPLKLNSAYSYLNKFCMYSNCQLGTGLDGAQSGWAKSLTQWSGGQTPWCQKWNQDFLDNNQWAKNILENADFADQHAGKNPFQVWDVQDSLITSAGCFCLPGIIKNFEKLRQVKCEYASCLKNDIPNLGVNKAECSAEKSFAECSFVVGEVWHLIPFTNVINYVTSKVGEIISDPITLIATYAGMNCRSNCASKPFASSGYSGCALMRTLASAGEAYQSYTQISKAKKDENKKVSGAIDYCERLKNDPNKI